ncbi:phage tail protein [Leclercia adecarboxylata]|uniref:phage tail-collar fiber domain-containing protein n=1 Tax=Leclercia adecarboxylata TaxID=83655 RepID=UPI0030D1C50E
MAKFKTIITTAGAAKIAAVLAGTASIVLDNTAKMAVGDGGGTLPTPNPAQTKLVREVYRAPINRASIDASDPKNIVVELVIPPEKPETSGFWIREMALYDAAGTLLAVGNMAETYKPSLSEGAGRKMVIRMVIAVSEVNAITITMDTSTVMATQDYVDSEIDKHAKSRNHPDATLNAKGFTQLSSSTTSTSETLAATPKAVKTVMDEAKLKAPLASPALTGTPTAPTAAAGNNSQQLANTQFVMTALAALVNSSPGALDTLSELAAALGNDPNFATTMLNALAAKAPLASPALTGKPTAPTAPQASNDKQLATTEFVTRAVAPAILMRGNLPNNANLNNYGPVPDFIGIWAQNSATNAQIVNGFPEDNAVGVLEVIPGGPFGGTQRYTVTRNGNIYMRPLVGTWNGTDGPWGVWLPVGFCSMPGYFTGDMNTLLTPGIWSITNAVTNGPIPAGQTATPTGICKVELRSSTDSVVQTFTSIVTNAAFINRTWTRTLSGSTWSSWDLQGTGALNDLGYGLTASSRITSFDWQQADFLTGSMQTFVFSSSLNPPSGVTYNTNTTVTATTIQRNSNAAVIKLNSLSASNGDRSEYIIVVTGAVGSRSFNVVRSYNSDSSTVIPLTNGGLGATTPEGGRKTLGFEDMGIGLASSGLLSSFDWQQADFLTGSIQVATFSAWVNPPSGVTYSASTTISIETIQARPNFFLVRLTPMTSSAGNRREYLVSVNGAKGARTLFVTQKFNDDPSSVIPVANGGTGSSTPTGGLANLGGAPLVSPALTGVPTAPTPAQTVNNTQIATTAFVKAALAALVNGSPAALDTLKELADALGGDANFSTTVLNALSGKQPINAALTSLSGLTGAADKLPYFVGKDLLVLSDFTAFARTLLSRNSAALVRADLNILTGPGWYKLGDLLIQYGTIDFTNTTTKTINFPIRYPTKVDQVIVSDAGWGGGNMWGATEQQPIGFTAHVNVSEEGGQWISFGR